MTLEAANSAAPGQRLKLLAVEDSGNPGFGTLATTGGGGGSSADRELVVTTYRAKAAGTGYSVGDTITAVRYINVSTGTPAQEGATAWYNETTAAAITAPSAANIELAGAPGLTDTQLRASPLPVSSVAGLVRITRTRPANTTAYAALDVIGDTGGSAIIDFASFGAANDHMLITSASVRYDVAALPSGMGALRLHLYTAVPAAIADNAAFSLVSGDRAAYAGWIDLSTLVANGATLFQQALNVNKHIKLAGTSLYGLLQTIASFTPAANSEGFAVELGGVKL